MLPGQGHKVDMHNMDLNSEPNDRFNDAALLTMKETKDAGSSSLFGIQPSENEFA